ncbi:hypothetical protein [Bradyrhizobium sp. USDA 4503]
MSTYVGRIDLTDAPLERYIDALMNDWRDQRCDPRAPVIWAVDHGSGDITRLMARTIAEKLRDKFNANDDLIGRRFLTGADATASNLINSLVELSPALVVTTSHGMTGAVDKPDQIAKQLGGFVDCNHSVMTGEHFDAWAPSGAIVYSHACCSAGADSISRYQDLFPKGSSVEATLNSIATATGAVVAPLPRHLLGLERPIRAFVGHVEPTFDWTLRDTANNQMMTHVINRALCERLYHKYERNPIGWAIEEVYNEAGSFFASWSAAVADVTKQLPGARDKALYDQLVAMDRQSTVILGDPTVSLCPM